MTDKEMKLERFKEENKNAVKGQIVLTGSSLMEMFPVNKFLAERGSDTIVYNRAIGGYITDELMQVLDTCVFELEPRRVFINIGTNDLSDSRIPMDRIMEHYEKITEANALVKLIAEKHGQHYIDINDGLKDEQGRLKAEYTIEGLHINEQGYRAIFDDFLKYLEN